MSNPSRRPEWLVDILESEHVFKGVGFVYFILLFGAVVGLFKLLTDDLQTFEDFGVLLAVLCGLAAAILAQFTLSKLGANDPLFGGDGRLKYYLYGGFAAAILLALMLSIYNHNGTVRARENEDTSRAAREAAGKFERNPAIERAAELINERRNRQATQATTRPSQK